MFLSMIIPVYNTEKYLAECLDSCLAQDFPYDDYEIICVNDGSKDGSLDILRSYEARYPNIIVIDQPNGGVSAARNAGLDAARGDYIWFIDADDFIQESVLAEIKALTAEKSPERLTFRFFEFDEALTDAQAAHKRAGEDIPGSHMGYSGICSGLFSRTRLQALSLRFSNLTHGEDILFVAHFFDDEIHVVYLERLAYYYRRNPQSATRSKSPEVRKNYLRSHIQGAAELDALYRHNHCNRSSKALWLMHFLQCIMVELARMPRSDAKVYLQELKSTGLYPYRIPAEYPVTDTGFTTRKDLLGRIYNWLVLHSCRPYGYPLLRLYYRLYHLLKR